MAVVGIEELSKQYAKKNGVSVKEAKTAIYAVIDAIESSVITGGVLQIINHFTLTKYSREAFTMPDKKGGRREVPKQNYLRFKIGKGLKKRINS